MAAISQGDAAGAHGFLGKLKPRHVKILRFQPYRNAAGTVRGFDAELPSGIIINGLKLLIGRAGKLWIALPGSFRTSHDGQPARDPKGKKIFDATIDFRDRGTRDQFSEVILTALRAQHPELFDGGSP